MFALQGLGVHRPLGSDHGWPRPVATRPLISLRFRYTLRYACALITSTTATPETKPLLAPGRPECKAQCTLEPGRKNHGFFNFLLLSAAGSSNISLRGMTAARSSNLGLGGAFNSVRHWWTQTRPGSSPWEMVTGSSSHASNSGYLWTAY